MRAHIFLLILMNVFHFGFSLVKYQLASYDEDYDEYLEKSMPDNYEKLSLLQYYQSKYNLQNQFMPPIHNYEYKKFHDDMAYYCKNTFESWNSFKAEYFVKFFSKITKLFEECIDQINTNPSGPLTTVSKIFTKLAGNSEPPETAKKIIKEAAEYWDGSASKNVVQMKVQQIDSIKYAGEQFKVYSFNTSMYGRLNVNQYNAYIACQSHLYFYISQFNDDSFKGDIVEPEKTSLGLTYPMLRFTRLALSDNPKKADIKKAFYKFLEISPPQASEIEQECQENGSSISSVNDEYYRKLQKAYKALKSESIDYFNEFAALNDALEPLIGDFKPIDHYNELLKNENIKEIIIKLQVVKMKESDYKNYLTYLQHVKMHDTMYMDMHGYFQYDLDPIVRRLPLGYDTWKKSI